MPRVTMRVTKTELTSPTSGQITAEAVNGPITGTLVLRAGKAIVKSVDPGDDITVSYQRE